MDVRLPPLSTCPRLSQRPQTNKNTHPPKIEALERQIFGESDDEDDLDAIADNFDLEDVDRGAGDSADDRQGDTAEDGGAHAGASASTDWLELADNPSALPSFKRRTDGDGDDAYSKSGSKSNKQKSSKSKKRRNFEGGSARGGRSADADRSGDADREDSLDPDAAKRRQASADVDAVIKRLVHKRAKRDLKTDTDADDIMRALLQRMKEASATDMEFNRNKQPAIAKLKLLPSVMNYLGRVGWHNQLLENNILFGIKLWLEPLVDGSLPSLDIQKNMMDTLLKMPVLTEHLEESKVGRVVMFYTKCTRVTLDIRRMADELIRQWMRPILKRNTEYKFQELPKAGVDIEQIRASMPLLEQIDNQSQALAIRRDQQRADAEERRISRRLSTSAGDGPLHGGIDDGETPREKVYSQPVIVESSHARIPAPIATAFTYVPVSNVTGTIGGGSRGGGNGGNGGNGSGGGGSRGDKWATDKYRKLKSTMKAIKMRK